MFKILIFVLFFYKCSMLLQGLTAMHFRIDAIPLNGKENNVNKISHLNT